MERLTLVELYKFANLFKQSPVYMPGMRITYMLEEAIHEFLQREVYKITYKTLQNYKSNKIFEFEFEQITFVMQRII